MNRPRASLVRCTVLYLRVAGCTTPFALCSGFATTVQAQPRTPHTLLSTEIMGSNSSCHLLESEIGASNFATGIARVAYRYAGPSGLQLGAQLSESRAHEAFFSGYAVDGAWLSEARGQFFAPLTGRGPLTLQLRVEAGTRLGWATDDSLLERGAADDRVVALTSALGLRGNVRAAPNVALHTGVSVPVSYQIHPEGTLDVVGAVIESGMAVALADHLWLTGGFDIGGIFGSDGDAGKMLLQGLVGVRGVFAQSTYAAHSPPNPDVPPQPSAPRPGSDVSAFIHSGWRVSGQARHVSHGPAIEAGVLVLRHLKVGIASHMRPGPMNPATFTVTPVDGQTYKGQDTLRLRSDGNFLGLLLAPIIDVSETGLQLEVPVAIGQAVYGFYLTGDDRVTPDGRRVSAWEDELQDGKDAAFAFGLDAGLRAAYKLRPWLRVAAGAHYTATFGYAAFAADDYSGPSASLGIELGGFD